MGLFWTQLDLFTIFIYLFQKLGHFETLTIPDLSNIGSILHYLIPVKPTRHLYKSIPIILFFLFFYLNPQYKLNNITLLRLGTLGDFYDTAKITSYHLMPVNRSQMKHQIFNCLFVARIGHVGQL